MSPAEEKEVIEVAPREDPREDLREEINYLRKELAKLRHIIRMLPNSSNPNPSNNTTNNPIGINTINHAENQTNKPSLTPSCPLFSTGNEGVQTNRQIDASETNEANETNMPEARDMLEAVNQLKVELKQKFRRLTKQEFKVFSAIYMLEEQGSVDYPMLANKLGLSETAIRDYIMKIIKKGIPVVKTKINNKKVMLNIRQELKQLASLDNLVKIREPVFS